MKVLNVVLCFYLILFNKAATSAGGRLCGFAAEGDAALVLQDWLNSFSVLQSWVLFFFNIGLMSFSSYQEFNQTSSSIFSLFLNTVNYFIVPVLRVLLGGLAPVLWLLDLNRSHMGWPRVSAVLDTCLHMATMRPAFGGGSHGVCEVGVPSPGDQASWGEKKQERKQKKLPV